jgi:uncharacterized protein YijF (DUF1287 family)
MSIDPRRTDALDPFRKRHIDRRLFLLTLASAAVPAVARAEIPPATDLLALVQAARSQIGVTLRYDPAYVSLPYPRGDVPPDRGVCTDVVIRAYRKAYGCDLQSLVHEDMARTFQAYPKTWGMKGPDKNIDHRRVPNLQTFFERQKARLPVTDRGVDYLPGDLVTVMLPGNLPHIMIVSDRKRSDGLPLVIHNIGQGTREEDYLFGFPRTGHYRFVPRRNQESL